MPAELPPGLDLHLDATLGCAGDMWVAALLDAGAPVAALRQGLIDAGLIGVGPLVSTHGTGSLSGTRVVFVDALGQPLERAPAGAANAPGLRSARIAHRRDGPSPHRDHRRGPVAAEMGKEAGEEGEEAGGDDVQVFAGPGAGSPEPAPAPGRIARWLDDHEATGGEMLDLIKESHLPPITRALVLRSLRVLLEGRAASRAGDATHQSFPGRPALDALCDIVGACALVRALDPARVTVSRVTVSTAPVTLDGEVQPGPLSWVLACLQGLPIDEQDLPHPCTTPTGAALLKGLARRAGPRRFVTERARGVGFGSLAVPGVANVCRVLLSEPAALPTEEGAERHGPLVLLSATLLSADPSLPSLLEALVRGGGHDVHTSAILDEERNTRTRVHVLAPPAVEEALGMLLLRHGAAVLVRAEVQQHAPGVREVTVALGSAKKKLPVRICERTWAGELLSAEPAEADLQRAAQATGQPVAALRADALAAWRRLSSPPAGASTKSSTAPEGAKALEDSEGDDDEP